MTNSGSLANSGSSSLATGMAPRRSHGAVHIMTLSILSCFIHEESEVGVMIYLKILVYQLRIISGTSRMCDSIQRNFQRIRKSTACFCMVVASLKAGSSLTYMLYHPPITEHDALQIANSSERYLGSISFQGKYLPLHLYRLLEKSPSPP